MNYSDVLKEKNFNDVNKVIIYPCIICNHYDGGEYVMESKIDGKEESGLTVLSRACKDCWLVYRKFIGQLESHYKYGCPNPWPPSHDAVRRYVLKNPEIRKSLLISGFKV